MVGSYVDFGIRTNRDSLDVTDLDQVFQVFQNFFFIQSSLRVNTPERKLPGYSKVFTVYTPKYLKEHPEVKINCGAKSCVSCRLCYTTNNVQIVNERLKGKKAGKSP